MGNEFTQVLEIRAKIDPLIEQMRALAVSESEEDSRSFYQLKEQVEKLSETETKLLQVGGLTQEGIFGESVGYRSLEGVNLLTGQVENRAGNKGGGPEYRALWGAPKETGGYKSVNDFLTDLSSGRHSPQLEEQRFINTMVPSEGGFTIPEMWAAEIMDKALEQEIVRPRTRIWPMTSEVLHIAGWNGFNHSGGDLYGGFSGGWIAEGGTATNEDPQYRQITLDAKKLAIYTQASREMVNSGIDFEQQLSSALFKSIGWHLDHAFLTGTGAGMPLGVFNSPGVVTVDPEPGQAAGTIVHENLAAIFSRLHPSLINNSVWVCNSTCIPQLLNLSIAAGTGGVHIPVMSQSSGQFTMLTRPVIFTEKVPAIGNRADISLINFSEYAIGMKQEIVIDKSNAPGWQQDLMSYRIIVACDAQGTWPDVFTPANGLTQGWAVTLGAR